MCCIFILCYALSAKCDKIYIGASKFSDKNTIYTRRGLVTFSIPNFGLVHFKIICQALMYHKRAIDISKIFVTPEISLDNEDNKSVCLRDEDPSLFAQCC
jgi:hypothetical protein